MVVSVRCCAIMSQSLILPGHATMDGHYIFLLHTHLQHTKHKKKKHKRKAMTQKVSEIDAGGANHVLQLLDGSSQLETVTQSSALPL